MRLALFLLGIATLLAPQGAESRTRVRRPNVLADANTAFALDLYARLRGVDGNLAFAPFSISTALAMTYEGAAAATATELGAVTRLADLDRDLVHEELAAVIRRFGAAKGVELRVANRLFGQQGYPFRKPYLKLVKKAYAAALETVDFRKKPDAARQRINAWVEKQTKKKIRDLMPAGSLDDRTRLVLVNALSFKGAWTDAFDPADTRDEPFTTASGAKVQAAMMHRTGAYLYAEDTGVKLLELPFGRGDLAMLVLLPDDPGGLRRVEERLTAAQLADWVSSLRSEDAVQVALPRFRASGKLALAELLSAMGMPSAFDPDRADFSGMTDGAGKLPEPLHLTAVHHQAWIAVTEEGAEAAAATGVAMGGPTSARPVPVFTADHPFIYLVRDVQDGHILFLGRIVDPSLE